jgi:TRAP transporter TAXI family solute receptor
MRWTPSRLLLALALAAVAGHAGPAAAQPRALTLGTASVGGTYFIYGGVVATLLTERLGINVSTQQTQGPNQNIILLDAGRIELGMTTMGIALQAWNGTGPWTRGRKFQAIRALFPMYDTPFHFVATERSPVRSVADLQGKVVGVGPRAGTPGTYFPLIFEALGIRATIRNGSASDMVGQLGDGLIDAFAFAAGLPIASFAEIEAQRPVRYFTFTDAQIATLKQRLPELSDAVVPKGTYKRLAEDHRTVGVFNFFVAHRSLPEDLAYRVTRAVLDNQPALVKGHAAARETVAEHWVKNTFLPFHPGAVRYYREKGITIPAKLAGG